MRSLRILHNSWQRWLGHLAERAILGLLERVIDTLDKIEPMSDPLDLDGFDPGVGSDVRHTLLKIAPGLSSWARCPSCDYLPGLLLFEVVVHLNDIHEWTRPEIADWLETLDVDLSLTPRAS